MSLYIRVDSGHAIGLGHVVRCLSIAKCVRQERGSEAITFLTDADSDSADLIRADGFAVRAAARAPEEELLLSSVTGRDRDTILIDKLFNYSEEFVARLRSRARVVMLHNYCSGGHLSDVYIVPGAHADPEILRSERWSNGTVMLYHGLEYVALNADLAAVRGRAWRPRALPRIVLTTGGSDPAGVMLRALEWADALEEPRVEFVALLGRLFEHGEVVRRKYGAGRGRIRVEPYDLHLLADADAAFCTFGNTVYELMYLGMPAISVGIGPRHITGSRNLAARCPGVIDLGDVSSVGAREFGAAVSRALTAPRNESSCRVDGAGASRIAGILCNLSAGTNAH